MSRSPRGDLHADVRAAPGLPGAAQPFPGLFTHRSALSFRADRSRGSMQPVSAPNRRISAPQRGPSRVVLRRPAAGGRLTTPGLTGPAAGPADGPHIDGPAVSGFGTGGPAADVRDPGATETDLSGPHAVELAGLLHELTARLLSAESFSQALERLAAFTARAVPGVVRCSVALIGDGGLTTAAHGGAGQGCDQAQYASSTGPSLEAARTRALVTVRDLTDEPRWPELAAPARAEDVRSAVAVPLDVQRHAVGALTVYAERPDGVDPGMLLTTMAVVNQAEVLLAELRRRDGLAEGEAVGRAAVDRAVGVIIAQRNCGVREAYAFLQDTAARLGLDRETVADRLIAAVARPSD